MINGHFKQLEGVEERRNMLAGGFPADHIALAVERNACKLEDQTTEPCVNGANNANDAADDRRLRVPANRETESRDPMRDHTSLISTVSVNESSAQDPPAPGNLQSKRSAIKVKIMKFLQPAAKFIGRWLPRERRTVIGFTSASIPGALQPDMISPNISEGGITLNSSPFTSMTKSTIQVAVAVALVGGSFSVMLQVPGGVNESGSAVMGHTRAFKVFLVTDIVAFQTSVVVCMTAATLSQIPSKFDYLICAALWIATMCFTVSFHAAVYVVVLPNLKLVVLLSVAIFVIAMVLLALYYLFAVSQLS